VTSSGNECRVKLVPTLTGLVEIGKDWSIRNNRQTPFLATGNICYILGKEPVSGFAGFKYKEKIKNTMVIGAEKIGSREVIYIIDDPYFRAFWKSGRVLPGNTVPR
jgi:hypothetical protein